MNKSRGIILVSACFIIAIILVLTGAFLTSSITEKRASEIERLSLQGLYLAEAGANHGLSELRERIRTDLRTNVEEERQGRVFAGYVDNQDGLGLLRDFAYATGDSQFTIQDNAAYLTLSPLDLGSDIQGSYSATIVVTEDGDSTNPQSNVYVFSYRFYIESIGSTAEFQPPLEKEVGLWDGQFTVTIRQDNFAKFALFTNHHRTPSGVTVWFTNRTNFTGPVHTNERFSFALNPSGSFSEEVTQHLNEARFYNNGWPRLLDADSNPPFDVPDFQKTFVRGYDEIVLESAITQDDLRRQALGGGANSRPNGMYVPNDGTNTIGGVYIQGDAIVSMDVDDQYNPVYTITQGATTKVITADYVNNQTIIQEGEEIETYQGLPDGMEDEGILLYTDGNIDSLSGTVARPSSLTVSSERDIVISGHILYQDYDPGPPLNASGYTNLLGILSWGGDIRIGISAPDDINIYATVMAPHGIFTVDNFRYGSPRGTATLLGGVITDFYGPFGTFSRGVQRSGFGRNFIYDARMLQGFSPPYFPTMTRFTSFDGGLDSRLLWEQKR